MTNLSKIITKVDFEKIVRIVSMLTIAIAVFHYLVIFLPHVEKERTKRAEANSKLQEDCLRDSTNKLQTVLQGSDPNKTDKAWIETYLKVHESQKDDCYKRFPSG